MVSPLVRPGAVPSRLVELDALRGLAALAVVAFHYLDRYPRLTGGEPLPGLWPGQYGVNLFFIISGFVILMTLERCATPLDFVITRGARLYPAYWAAVLCTATVVALCGLPGREVGWATTAANLLMVHGWAGVAHVDGVYWTLGIEMGFYALMLGVRCLGWLRQVELVLFGWLAAATAVEIAVGLGWTPLSIKLAKAALLVPYAHFFILGCALYRWRHGPSPRVALGVAVLAMAAFITLHRDAEAIAMVVCAVVFVAAIAGWLRWLAWSPLLLLGLVSYPLYLVHQNIGYVVIRELTAAGVVYPLAAAGACGLVLGLAAAITRWVETPSREAIRCWRRRREVIPQARVPAGDEREGRHATPGDTTASPHPLGHHSEGSDQAAR